jgi:gamma-glutamyltranspeptidase/glutathione hydrolase
VGAPAGGRDQATAFGFILKGRVNDIGPQSIGTPATLKGLEAMHQAHGRLPWQAGGGARHPLGADGYFVRPGMHAFWIDEPSMGRVGNLERLQYCEDGRQLYCRPDGRAKPIGMRRCATKTWPPCCARVAKEGAMPVLPRRPGAKDGGAHGVAGRADHARRPGPNTEVQRNPPLVGRYRDRTITTNQPPGGGAMLLEMLNILEHFDLASLEHNSPAYLQSVCEAMKKATIDKDRCIGDPRFFDVPLDRLLSKDMRPRSGRADPHDRFNMEAREPRPRPCRATPPT